MFARWTEGTMFTKLFSKLRAKRGVLVLALVAGLGLAASCSRLTPPPASTVAVKEQTSMGRAPAEPSVGPGVPPTGPVIKPRPGEGEPDRSAPAR
jgi:hypothetical protein